nr:MAG TPA: hypothetical protein [Caudoviricetes sp.]
MVDSKGAGVPIGASGGTCKSLFDRGGIPLPLGSGHPSGIGLYPPELNFFL